MNETTLQRTLVAINDGLAAMDGAKLVALRPHPAARDSLVAAVDLPDYEPSLALLPLAEAVYKQLGVLVLFRTNRAPDA